MKFLLVATLSLMSLSSWSNMHGKHQEMDKMMDKMTFEEAKKMKTEMLTQKKTMVEEAQTCVGATTDKDGLRACMHKMHEEKNEMHSDMKDKMKKKM